MGLKLCKTACVFTNVAYDVLHYLKPERSNLLYQRNNQSTFFVFLLFDLSQFLLFTETYERITNIDLGIENQANSL